MQFVSCQHVTGTQHCYFFFVFCFMFDYSQSLILGRGRASCTAGHVPYTEHLYDIIRVLTDNNTVL